MRNICTFLMIGFLFLSCNDENIKITKKEITGNQGKLYLSMISTNDTEFGKETFLECHNEDIAIGFKFHEYIKAPQIIDTSEYNISAFKLRDAKATNKKKIIIHISFSPTIDVDFPYMINLRKENKILKAYYGFENNEYLSFKKPKVNKLSKTLLFGKTEIIKSNENEKDSIFNVFKTNVKYIPSFKDNTLILDKIGWVLIEYI